MKCVHEVEIIEVKMALYAEHKRDLLELKEGRERELERLRAFFAAVRARGDCEVAGPAALSLSPSPAVGATGVLPGQACSTGARAEAAAAASSSPAPGPAPISSSSASSSPNPTPPEIPPPTAAPTSPRTPSSPRPPRPGTARAAAPHVRFLTTGITPAEAKSKAKSVRVEKEAGEGQGRGMW